MAPDATTSQRRTWLALPLSRGKLLALAVALYIVTLALLGVLGYSLITSRGASSSQAPMLDMSYTDFRAQVQAGNVAWVYVASSGQIEGKLKCSITGHETQSGTCLPASSDQFHAVYPFQDTSALRADLQQRGVTVRDGLPGSSNALVSDIVLAAAILISGALATPCLVLARRRTPSSGPALHQ